MLLALILRVVAFEYRGKVDSVRWRRNWDRAIVFGSMVPALGVGAVLATNVVGLPLNARGGRVGPWLSIFLPETLLGALAVAGFALVHGADTRERGNEPLNLLVGLFASIRAVVDFLGPPPRIGTVAAVRTVMLEDGFDSGSSFFGAK